MTKRFQPQEAGDLWPSVCEVSKPRPARWPQKSNRWSL